MLGASLSGVATSGLAQAAERLERMKEVILTPEMIIEGRSADLFNITWIGVGQDGRMAVSLFREANYSLFSSSGRRIATIGRPGAGPGEFGTPEKGAWVGDTLWLYDRGRLRFSVHTADGKYVRNVPMPAFDTASRARHGVAAMIGLHPAAVLPNGDIVGAATLSTAAPRGSGLPIVSMDLQGRIKRVIGWVPVTKTSIEVKTGPARSTFQTIPFAWRPVWAISPDGRRIAIVVADAKRSVMRATVLSGMTGDTILNREWTFVARPIPQRLSDSARNRVLANARAKGFESAMQRDLVLPAAFPPVTDLVLGNDGTMWMRVNVGDQPRWRIFDHKGRSLGESHVTGDPAVVTADKVWLVEGDADGFHSIRRSGVRP
jgi:hypothetical protein